MNTGGFTINKSATGLLTQPTTSINGASNPLMFSAGIVPVSCNNHNGGADAAAAIIDVTNPTFAAGGASFLFTACGSSNIEADKTISINFGIASARINNITYSHKQSICQLIVPSYKLSPQIEKGYISQGKIKHVWEDQSNFLLTVGANSSFSSYIGSRPRMTRIIICPFLTTAANQNLEPQKSAFCSEPSTCSPCLGSLLKDFNIECGGELLFRQNINYGPEMFLSQMEQCQNGNLSAGLTSGFFSYENWLGSYGYIVLNVRKSEVNYNTDLKIKIQGTSHSNKEMQLSIFLCYEKSCDVNLITGQLENIIV
jgi:hypothetical protein